jgi:hypothetical protein
MNSEIGGIPFIGENGYYPSWARGSRRWLFQRTVVVVGTTFGDIARLHASSVPVSDQMIVWSPPRRFPILGTLPSAVHRERERALTELHQVRLVCYGENCKAPKPAVGSEALTASAVIRESGVQPDKWFLLCPFCSGTVGPDISGMAREPLIMRWQSHGRPPLENPGAGAGWESIPEVVDLPKWIDDLQPSHLELAYLGQQLWPNIASMLEAMPHVPRPSR